jgi:hypothetical protein
MAHPHGPLVRIFFRSSSLDGRVVMSQAGRVKDEFDHGQRELLELADVQPSDGDSSMLVPRALVSLQRMVCAAMLEPGLAPVADPSVWGTRVRRAVAVRCDGVDVRGSTHVPIGASMTSWLSSRERRFLALTDASVTPWGQEALPFEVVFVNRDAVETAWWQSE